MADTTPITSSYPRLFDPTVQRDGSITADSFTHMTPEQFRQLRNTDIGGYNMYLNARTARISGARENTLVDLLYSTSRDVSGNQGKNADKDQRIPFKGVNAPDGFLPYMILYQEDIMNIRMFNLVGADADPDAGQVVDGETRHPGAWRLILEGSQESFKATKEIPDIKRHFIVGENVIILTHDPDTDGISEPYMEIVAVDDAPDGPGGRSRAYVVVKPNRTAAWWNTATDDEKAEFQPTTGLVKLALNSVSDYEDYCRNQPVNANLRLKYFFFQTMRYTHTWEEEGMKMLSKILGDSGGSDLAVNPYWKQFKALPMAQQEAQMRQTWDEKMVNTVFYGQGRSEFQDPENYKSAGDDKIYDDFQYGTQRFLAYKTNLVGFLPQLRAAGRTVDFANKRLDFDVLLETIEETIAFRNNDRNTGMSHESITFLCTRATFLDVQKLMVDYYKRHLGATAVDLEAYKLAKFDKIGPDWKSASYEIRDIQAMIQFIQVGHLTDERRHAKAGTKMAARLNCLMGIDWTDAYVGRADTARRKTEFPQPDFDPAYRCRIKIPKHYTELESQTLTAVIEDEKRHLIIENFNDECPKLTYRDCGIFTGTVSS